MSYYEGRQKKQSHKYYHDEDTLWEKILYKYYKIVPYDWRPHQIWYRLKCCLWKRYTTIKPRYLGHTWCDRDLVLLHMNFEILCQFIEKECSPGHINWDSDEYTKNSMLEMLSLYRWWIDCHTDRPDDHYGLLDKQFDELFQVYQYLIDESGGVTESIPLYDENGKIYAYEWQIENEDDDKHYDYVMARANLERIHDEFLEKQLIRLIKVRRMMWT